MPSRPRRRRRKERTDRRGGAGGGEKIRRKTRSSLRRGRERWREKKKNYQFGNAIRPMEINLIRRRARGTNRRYIIDAHCILIRTVYTRIYSFSWNVNCERARPTRRPNNIKTAACPSSPPPPRVWSCRFFSYYHYRYYCVRYTLVYRISPSARPRCPPVSPLPPVSVFFPFFLSYRLSSYPRIRRLVGFAWSK